MSNILTNIADAENFKISNEQIKQIEAESGGNLRRAILQLQHRFMTRNSQEDYHENWKQCISANIVGRTNCRSLAQAGAEAGALEEVPRSLLRFATEPGPFGVYH